MPSIKEYMDLAQDTINATTIPSATDGWTEVILQNPNLTDDPSNSFFARVYQKGTDVIIAFRYSDSVHDWLNTNASLLLNTAVDQFRNAQELYDAVKSQFLSSAIHVTGYSLGGALAEMIGAKEHVHAVTFNGAGTKDSIAAINAQYNTTIDPNATYNNIQNYVIDSDLVGNILPHLGNIAYVNSPALVNLLHAQALSAVGPAEIPAATETLISDFLASHLLPNFNGLANGTEVTHSSNNYPLNGLYQFLRNGVANLFTSLSSPVYSNPIFADPTSSVITLGGNDNEYYIGNDLDNYMLGNSGNNLLAGGDGNDTIDGGTGNDYLIGGNGTNKYIFNIGGGQDTLYSDSGQDVLQFGSGISRNEVESYLLSISNGTAPLSNDLQLTIGQGGGMLDSVTLYNQIQANNTANHIGNISFYDGNIKTGTKGSESSVVSSSNTEFFAFGGDDIVQNFGNNDFVFGGLGNDTLVNLSQNSTLAGGLGNDYLINGGHAGTSTTYVFNLGDGSDTIQGSDGIDTIRFGPGISKDRLQKSREGNNLIISIKGTSDQITILNNYSGDALDEIGFEDGYSPFDPNDPMANMGDISFFDQNGNSDNWFSKAENTTFNTDPILLDLDGNGLKTTSLEEGRLFDADSTGFSELTAWVAPTDGLLVADLNNNGIIDNGAELLGNHTVLPNGSTAHDGYYALAAYDSNGDYVVDSSDQNFSQLKVLKGDGTLLTLQEAGVKSLSLIAGGSLLIDENGNSQTIFGTYTKLDNTIAQYGDFNLKTNTAISNPQNWTTVSNEIAALPNVAGKGNVYDLQQAMAMDSSGALQGLVEDFLTATTESSRNTLLDQILAAWTGVPQSTTLQNGSMLTAFHMAVVEKFEGHNYLNDPNSFVGTIPAGFISQDFNRISENLYGKLMAQTQLKDYFSEIIETKSPVTGQYSLNLDSVESKIETLYQTDAPAAIAIAGEFARSLMGLGWADISNYSDFYTALNSLDIAFQQSMDSAGKATIIGSSTGELLGSDGVGAWDLGTGQSSRDTRPYYLVGAAGNDTLQGSYSNDILIGGTGNDTLYGYDGNDAYYFNLGDGQDTIIEGNAFTDAFLIGQYSDFSRPNTGYDSIYFGPGIQASDLSYAIDGQYLVISINGTTDQIRILSKYSDYLVEQIVFQDGTVINTADIFHTFILEGTSGNDNLTAQNIFSDVGQHIKGYGGNDSLYSGTGNDTMEGGDGNDYLLDRGGNNLLDGGDGDDGIEADGGINTIDGGAGNDYLWNVSGTATIFGGDGNDSITAGEGNDSIDGGSGADTVVAGDGNDTITGGLGNDSLVGGNGNDTYLFNTGFGQDTVDEHTTSGQDVLSFGSGINASDATFTGTLNNDLVIHFNNSTDQVTVVGQLATNSIENFHFADSDLTAAQILTHLQTQGTEDFDYIRGSNYSESIFGYGGSDQLIGYDGNDTIYGGDGNDAIEGVEGNDSLLGGNGNDNMSGGNGNDILEGGDGNDSLGGDNGNDTLIGGIGNESLYGGTGSDTYIYNAGDGYDTIIEDANTDNNILSLGGGLNSSNVALTFDDRDLWVRSLLNPSDQIRVTNQVTNHTLGTIQFSDGTTYNAAQILSHLQSFGTDYNDNVYGSNQAESLFGFAGNDTLWAGAGDDTLDAGDGDDVLYAADGNDSLIGGAGNDTLNGENGDDILLGGAGNDRINAGDGNDQLIGGDGSDVLLASDGNDTLSGGTGNDYLYGEAGNDTFLYAAGDGNDIIVDSSGSNTLAFDSSISQSVVALFQDQYGQLLVGFNNSSTDQVTVNSLPNLGEIQLSNGNYLTNTDLNLIIQDMSSYATTNSVSLTSLSDVESNSGLMAIINGAWHAA